MQDKLMDFFRKHKREDFPDEEYRDLARFDGSLFIGCGQTISQPSLVLEMTAALELSMEHKVLEDRHRFRLSNSRSSIDFDPQHAFAFLFHYIEVSVMIRKSAGVAHVFEKNGGLPFFIYLVDNALFTSGSFASMTESMVSLISTSL